MPTIKFGRAITKKHRNDKSYRLLWLLSTNAAQSYYRLLSHLALTKNRLTKTINTFSKWHKKLLI